MVRAATPRWARPVALGCTWVATLAAALLLALVGAGIDGGLTPATTWLGAALVAASAGSSAVAAVASSRAVGETEGGLRRRLVRALYDAGVTGAGPSGRFLSLATDGVEKAAQYRAGFLGPILGAMTAPLVALGVMAVFVDARIAGLLALLLVVVPVVIGGFQRLVRPVGAQYRRSQGRLTAAFLEAVQALETLVYARAGRRVARDLARRGETHRRGIMRLLAVNQLLILVLDLAFSLTLVVAAAVLAVGRVHQETLSLGAAVAVVLIALLATGPVDVVGQFFYIGIGGRAAAELQRAGIVARADTLARLAERIGADPATLTATVDRFNGFARAGVDGDFGRGNSAYDRYYGDPSVRPNPNLGPLEKGPFEAWRIVIGDLGTKGGVVTDEHARALREDGSVIEGLYSAGNNSASVMGRTYPGPGSTIGPATVFGLIAGRHMAAKA